MGEVRQHFRPEFLNRVDEVILFERLRRDQMADIVDIQMHRLEELAAARGLKVQLDTAARDWLAERGYDPVYGARPLKRTIQKHVQDALADKILAGDIEDGSLVLISEKKGDLVVSSQANAEPVH
jgi:ATP-dependent Clp protease ATP-binding subunit ClpB